MKIPKSSYAGYHVVKGMHYRKFLVEAVGDWNTDDVDLWDDYEPEKDPQVEGGEWSDYDSGYEVRGIPCLIYPDGTVEDSGWFRSDAPFVDEWIVRDALPSVTVYDLIHPWQCR